jgi:hypothetical protein
VHGGSAPFSCVKGGSAMPIDKGYYPVKKTSKKKDKGK